MSPCGMLDAELPFVHADACSQALLAVIEGSFPPCGMLNAELPFIHSDELLEAQMAVPTESLSRPSHRMQDTKFNSIEHSDACSHAQMAAANLEAPNSTPKLRMLDNKSNAMVHAGAFSQALMAAL